MQQGVTFNQKNFYYRVNQSCNNGCIAFGYRWRNKGVVFTDEDKHRLNTSIQTYRCKMCGTKIGYGSSYCKLCYDKLRKQKVDSYNSYKGRQVPEGTIINYPFIKEELQELYPKYTANSIAKYVGVSYSTVNKWLKQYGLK